MRRFVKRAVSGSLGLMGLGALAVILNGCGRDAGQNSATSIYGGKAVAKGQWQTTVALADASGIYCSGTLIHPQVVITAAHCAYGKSPGGVTVHIGNGLEGGSLAGQVAVSKIASSPRYSVSNDIAYLVLKSALKVPEGILIPVLTDKDEKAELLQVGKEAQVVGFGLRNGGGYGVKYEVTAKVTGLTSNEIYVGGSGKDSCGGDSGGPVFGQLANGEWRVYGVTSRGGACGTGGIYGLMHANICWVQQSSGIDLQLPAGTCGTGPEAL